MSDNNGAEPGRQVRRAQARKAAKGQPKPFNPPPGAVAGVVVSVVPREPTPSNPAPTELKIERFGDVPVDGMFQLLMAGVSTLYSLRVQALNAEIDSQAMQAAAHEADEPSRIWSPGMPLQ